MKILYLSNIPSPYRVDYFNELGKTCELTVLFELETSSERDESWKRYAFDNFRGVFLRGKRTSVDTAFCPEVVRYLRQEDYDHIVITTLASLTGQLAVTWLRMHKKSYDYEGDGGTPGKKSGFKAFLKRRVIAHADRIFSTGPEFDRYCMTYGAKRERIVRYPFSSVRQADILPSCLGDDERKAVREALGITEPHMVVSVGRMIHLKGFDVLLKAWADVWQEQGARPRNAGGAEDGSWGLYLVGGQPSEELQQIVRQRQPANVHFVEFVEREKIWNYYKAADFFVLPTRYDPWGLVVNEAMACGLPVLTTKQCFAAQELVRKNGLLYDCEDAGMLAVHLKKLCDDKETRVQMGQKSLEIIRGYTIETMAEAHIEEFAKKSGRG